MTLEEVLSESLVVEFAKDGQSVLVLPAFLGEGFLYWTKLLVAAFARISMAVGFFSRSLMRWLRTGQ